MLEKSEQIAEIIDNLRRVFQVVHGQSKKAERETGLTSPQLWTIKVIAEAGSITGIGPGPPHLPASGHHRGHPGSSGEKGAGVSYCAHRKTVGLSMLG